MASFIYLNIIGVWFVAALGPSHATLPSFGHLPSRFATNADEPGVEKIAICKVNTELLTEPIPVVFTAQIAEHEVQGDSMNEYLPPMSVFYVKGFTRCFCAVAVLLYAYKNQDVLEAGLDGP